MQGKIIYLKFLLSLTLLAASSSYADFDFAVMQYNQGSFEKAYREFKQAAELGDHDAQYNLAAMYYRGEYVKKDLVKSYAWFALAAQDENYQEEKLHQKLYQKLSPENQELAAQLRREFSAKYTDEAIQRRLIPNYDSSAKPLEVPRLVKSVPPKIPDELANDPDGGWVDLLFTIDKNGNTRDHLVYFTTSEALADAAISAVRGWQYEPKKVNSQSVTINGVQARIYFHRVGLAISEVKSTAELRELKQKAITGDADDQLKYAYFLGTFPPHKKNHEISDNPNEWYAKAAINGNSTAGFFLAQNLLTGNMCEQDAAKAMGWLLKTAYENVTEAQYFLALELFNGVNFERNEEKALYWLERSANSNPAAQIRMAWILATHPDSKIRNSAAAETYLAKVPSNYPDKQSLFRTNAAVAAEQKNFNRAIEWQQKALKDAKKLDLSVVEINAQLAAYNNKQPWREAL